MMIRETPLQEPVVHELKAPTRYANRAAKQPWTVEEEKMLYEAWCDVSMDNNVGDALWS